MNYLPDAHAHGAEIFTEIDVWARRSAARRALAGPRSTPLDAAASGSTRRRSSSRADVVVLARGHARLDRDPAALAGAGLPLSDRAGPPLHRQRRRARLRLRHDVPVNGVGSGDGAPDGRSRRGRASPGSSTCATRPSVDDGMVIEDAVLPRRSPAPCGRSSRRRRTLPRRATRRAGSTGERAARGSTASGRTRRRSTNPDATWSMSPDDGDGRLVLDGDESASIGRRRATPRVPSRQRGAARRPAVERHLLATRSGPSPSATR